MNTDQKASAALLIAVLAMVGVVAGFAVTNPASIIPGETGEEEAIVGDLTGANLKTVLGLNSTDPSLCYNWTDSETGDQMVFNFTSGYWTIFDLDSNMTLRITTFDLILCDVDLEFANGTAQNYVNLTEPVTVDLLHTVIFYGQVPVENYTALVLNSTGIVIGFEASYTSPTANASLTLEFSVQTSEVYATAFVVNYTVGGPCNVTSETELTTYYVDNQDSFRDLYITYAIILWFLYWWF